MWLFSTLGAGTPMSRLYHVLHLHRIAVFRWRTVDATKVTRLIFLGVAVDSETGYWGEGIQLVYYSPKGGCFRFSWDNLGELFHDLACFDNHSGALHAVASLVVSLKAAGRFSKFTLAQAEEMFAVDNLLRFL